ncbi:hypothetical protein GLYMA_18G134450v4 [Glycine max]|nr:hypothetical protein GLYMA_18G134450v4 [Glycine max]KAH1154380.1 hypothetical protein GYH30_049884 [Glycine max]
MRSSFSKPSKFLSPVPHNVRAVPSSISLVLQSPSSSFPISFLISFDHPSSSLLLPLLASQEDPEVAKFREQGLKFLPEMEFLFKGTIAIGFAAYAPSKDSRQYEGFNTRT